jgi:hypothetical protein
MRVNEPRKAGVLAQVQVGQVGRRSGIARIDAFEPSITDNNEAAIHGIVSQAIDQRAATNSNTAVVRIERNRRECRSGRWRAFAGKQDKRQAEQEV